MDNNDLKERDFEAYIEHWLTTEGGYTKGNQATYDKERAIDLKTLIKFLRLTQMKKWELYEKKYGAQTEDRMYNVLQNAFNLTAYNIKWLQPKMMAQLVNMNTENEPIGMAAEQDIDN